MQTKRQQIHGLLWVKTPLKIFLFFSLFLAVSIVLLTIFIKTRSVPMMEPRGVIAMKERELIITAALLMMVVVLPVLALAMIFGAKYRKSNKKAAHEPEWEHGNIAECCWWGVPCVIVLILAIITYKTSHTLSPYRPIKSDVEPIEIQVVALDWKWLFLYPKQKVASVNFLQVPEKTPIEFELTSDAPMNSFWIPQLGGQIYAMPAMRTKLSLMASQVGDYKGRSAHISGKGFAGMHFVVKASTQEEFDSWVEKTKQSPLRLGIEEYNELVKPSEYHPAATYVLTQPDLFEQIIMKYRESKKSL